MKLELRPTITTPSYEPPLIPDSVVAVDEFISRAQLLSATEWLAPRAEGKWSPCQEAQHLILSFGFFREAVLGQRELALEVSPERSQALNAAVLPKLRAREPLPAGARSPARADPTKVAEALIADRESVLLALAAAGRAFQAALLEAAHVAPDRRVQHPYFGPLSIEEFAMTAAAHTRHHMRFLPGLEAPG